MSGRSLLVRDDIMAMDGWSKDSLYLSKMRRPESEVGGTVSGVWRMEHDGRDDIRGWRKEVRGQKKSS